jgi:hypothetical protein
LGLRRSGQFCQYVAMSAPPPAARSSDSVWPTLTLCVLWCALFIVPAFLGIDGEVQSVAVYAPPLPSAVAAAHHDYVWAGVLVLVIPVLGGLLALATGRQRNAIAFLVAFLVALPVAGTAFNSFGRHIPGVPAPTPQPSITRCVVYSGAPDTCPGG